MRVSKLMLVEAKMLQISYQFFLNNSKTKHFEEKCCFRVDINLLIPHLLRPKLTF